MHWAMYSSATQAGTPPCPSRKADALEISTAQVVRSSACAGSASGGPCARPAAARRRREERPVRSRRARGRIVPELVEVEPLIGRAQAVVLEPVDVPTREPVERGRAVRRRKHDLLRQDLDEDLVGGVVPPQA